MNRNYKNEKDLDDTLAALKKSLINAGVADTASNMRYLGIGQGIYLDWANHR
jgi:hypothetical protein